MKAFITSQFTAPLCGCPTAKDKVKKCITWEGFKGYLRYKTITSQNVPPKAQIKNFFIS